MKKHIGIVLLLLMLMSSFAFVGFQRQTVPTGSFGELTPEQERQLLSAGKTIIFYNRPDACQECEEITSFLQSISISYADQVVLIEREAESVAIKIKSAYGQKILGVATKERISAVLCEMMINPPATCINGVL